MPYEILTLFPLLIITNSFVLCMFKPPILMLASVITQAFLICALLKTLFKTAWFSLILFLIFIGGLMILFIYIVSLASNNEMTFSKTQITMMWFMAIFSLTALFSSLYTSNASFHSLNQMNLTSFLNKMYSLPSMVPISMIMVYLLLVLLITVSVALLKSGPLRSFTKIK